MASPLGEFVLWLHLRATEQERVLTTDEVADNLLCALVSGVANDAEGCQEGLELHRGLPRTDLARKVQRRAYSHLRDPQLVIDHIDENGYTPLVLRALLSSHYWRLRAAALGSDEWCVLADVSSAIDRASQMTRQVARLLIAGLGPDAIGELLQTNGSRQINRALAELARILEGRTTK